MMQLEKTRPKFSMGAFDLIKLCRLNFPKFTCPNETKFSGYSDILATIPKFPSGKTFLISNRCWESTEVAISHIWLRNSDQLSFSLDV